MRDRDDVRAVETPPRPDLPALDLEARMGHARLDECSDAAETKGQPLYNRISAKIQKLSDAKSEVEHMLKACGKEMDMLRAQAGAAEHRRLAAEYRAQRIVLDKELFERAEKAEAEVERLRAVGPRPEVETVIKLWREEAEMIDHKGNSVRQQENVFRLRHCADQLEAALRAVGEPADEKKSE